MDTDRHAGRNYFMKTPTPTIIKSLLILSRDIQSDDGVANAALREAAERMQDMFEMLQERCFYASAKNFKRSGYSLTVHWETAHRDIEYRDAPLYTTSEEAVEAELLKSVEPAQQ